MTTLTNATHTAHLDALTGMGALLMPLDADDLCLGGMGTLHSAGWEEMVARLASLGWEPLLDDETGDVAVMGQTQEGRTVVALYGLDPITSQPSLEQMAEAEASLRSVFGVA